jgi:hypothetical protein
MKQFFSTSRVVSWLLIISLAWVIFNTGKYKKEKSVIYWDVLEYYCYLPAAFIYKDVTLKFTEKDPAFYSDKFWPIPAPNGGRTSKMSMGMSILYSPFFFAAHLTAKLTDRVANGFSPLYKLSLQLSCLFYLSIGLYFLRRLLLRYFSETVTTLTLIGIVLGTNLFYYSSLDAPMSHAYNFSLFALFLFLTTKWYEKPDVKTSILAGLVSGLITLIRPTNIVILMVFVFWGIKNFVELTERIKLLLSKYYLILLITLFFIVVWIPQLIYWKYNTDQWFYYSYTKEKFFFSDPMIVKGLFSYRKGWLLYTPIMSFALIGFIMLYKQARELFTPILIFTIVNFYIVVCWWTWWYGGAFGMRPLIESYSLLAFPMAACLTSLLKTRLTVKIAGLAIFFLLVVYSLFETAQFYYGAIHWDGMTKEAYWETFGKLKPTGKFWQLVKEPDYDKAMGGERDQ